MDDSVIACDEVMESYDKEIKTILINFNKKNTTCKTQFLCFTYLFLNHRYIIDSC